MQAGFQTSGLSFWDHGSMVNARFRDLMNPNPNMIWRLPDWFTENTDAIRAKLVPDFDDIITYHQWHDCGKPLCRTVDEEGRAHYPDHANVSADIWLQLGGDERIGRWIRQDMICHTLKPADAAEFKNNPDKIILLVTALCELHANASMFGGIESTSFKIKYKALDKLGRYLTKE